MILSSAGGEKMESYTHFAKVYDTFMDNIPYADWINYLLRLFEKYGIDDKELVELGCGTGTVTNMLCAKGYKLIGVDNSSDMLLVAKEKNNKANITYINQDIRELEISKKYNVMFSICDTMNYMPCEYDLLRALQAVYNGLNVGGWFIFDLKTEYYYANTLGDTVLVDNREECSYIWENSFDRETKVNSYDLTMFIKEGDGYQRFKEFHEQMAFSRKQIKQCIAMAGFKLMGEFEAFTFKKPGKKSERLYYILRKEN
ncbi:MAG: class I SAM-dependent methyltransferase [Lachnospira sp.]|nr:class I SAM-dependent methyltransferase [Lachnospira sp.]